MRTLSLFSLVALAALPACQKPACSPSAAGIPRDGSATFGQDLSFLKTHTTIHVLEDPASGARVAVAPAWQGRVMTSTASGEHGTSLGWIHYANVETGILPEDKRTGLARHIHIFGGEERFWLGPEGGQYALFFPPAPAPYTFENWFTPALMDTEPFDVVARDASHIEFKKSAVLTNRANTKLHVSISRNLQLLNKAAISLALKSDVPDDLAVVAYRSTNILTNCGDTAWTPDSGLASIWLLGMFKHGPGVTVVVPLKEGPGKAVNADYFGELKPDRLTTTDKAVFFKADGGFRSKIGVPPARSTGMAASYDPARQTLTIVRSELPPQAATLPYVRSQWIDHTAPYAGDLINAYNDGSPAAGEPPLGPFYELETSSPALPLSPGKAITHVQETIHLEGPAKSLDHVARAVLSVSLEEITHAFTTP
ncbi:MAG: hypothetical protein RLZZ282_1784 [Verrucomicrobiota bacterium]